MNITKKLAAAASRVDSKKVVAAVALMAATGLVMAADGDDPGLIAIQGLQTKASAYISAVIGVAVLVAGGFWSASFLRKAFARAG